MFLLFSRPIEFLGVPAFYSILMGFVVVFAVSSLLLLLLSFSLKGQAASKGSEIKSWLAGFVVLGAAFLITNLILAIPVIIILLVIQTSVIEPIFDSSDQTFHKIDNFLTFLGIAVNLIGYFRAVKIFHQRIYIRFAKRRRK